MNLSDPRVEAQINAICAAWELNRLGDTTLRQCALRWIVAAYRQNGSSQLPAKTIYDDFYPYAFERKACKVLPPRDKRENDGRRVFKGLREKLEQYLLSETEEPVIIRLGDARGGWRPQAFARPLCDSSPSTTLAKPPSARSVEEQNGDPFSEVFGLVNEPHDSVIVLQSDSITDLTKRWAGTTRRIVGDDRVFKARRWVNACDTEAAQEILSAFSDRGRRPPRIVISPRGTWQIKEDWGTEIVLGGFAHLTERDVNEIGLGWLQFKSTRDVGDTIWIHERIVPRHRLLKPKRSQDSFVQIVPHDWAPAYMQTWLRGLKASPKAYVDDFAAILRHRNASKTRFFLLGFTEMATLGAGMFLAKKWERLHQYHRSTDLLVILAGKSHPNRLPDWDIVHAVTDEDLRKEKLISG